MCARFASKESTQALVEYFGAAEVVDEALGEWAPRYNVAPTQLIRVLRRPAGDSGLEIDALRWGVLPAWKSTGGGPIVNARAETAATKPTFREALIRRRCIVAMTGFYEWTPGAPAGSGTRPRRQPHFFSPLGAPMLAVAGIWNPGRDGDPGSVVLLTTAANSDLTGIHDRMPVIVKPHLVPEWLDPQLEDPVVITAMATSVGAGTLRSHKVSTEVNSVRSEGSHLIAEIAAGSDDLGAPETPQLFPDEFGR